MANLDTFIKQQNESARSMKDESNNLIEYYTVIKKAGKMILGEDAVGSQSFHFSPSEMRKSEAVESMFKQGSQEGYASSDSDDFFGSSENSKCSYHSNINISLAKVAFAQAVLRAWGLNCIRGWHN